MGPTLPPATPLGELAALFLRLGLTAFGGPAAHVAMMEAEVVRRRRWMDEARFLDLVGATALIPGPNSTELAILIGRERAGWRGLLVAGACFILPAALLTAALASAYVRWGALPEVGWLLRGVKPVVVAIILQAATLGIFLPAFLLVAALGPFLDRLRASPGARAFLDGVNVASLSLMGVAAAGIAGAAVVDGVTALLCLVSAVLLVGWRVNTTWLIAGAAVVAWVLR